LPDSIAENKEVNGKKEGLWVTYFANGNKRSEGAFKGGKKEGKWTLYHKNGNKQSEGTFQDGKYTGYYVSYHDNGQKFREGWYSEASGNAYDGRKEGVWYQYEADGETVSAKVTYKHGRVIERLNYPETDNG
jgi:hypothetical protein